jgi:hypothetical protein
MLMHNNNNNNITCEQVIAIPIWSSRTIYNLTVMFVHPVGPLIQH